MDTIIYYICVPLGYLMKWCYLLFKNYGVAIILFTLATKLVMLPISIWIQKNSIKMVKIQPQVNFIKANLSGNIDAIVDEQSKLFKKEKYHPMATLVPLFLQIFLLLAVVYIIYRPLNYLFGFSDQSIKALAEFINVNIDDSSFQLKIVEAIKSGAISSSMTIPNISEEMLGKIITSVESFNMSFCGLNMSIIPCEVWGVYVLVPILAAVSSWIMCQTQNMSNVIQHEQSKWNQYGIMILSVLLSLYLGVFVPSGIALYWIASNIFSVIQMYILNFAINPKKYVDYDALEKSREALLKSKDYGKVDKNNPFYKEMKKKEKEDYKKFKNIINKHIVFYSEKSGFYKYYKDIIEQLLKKSNIIIHYVTNDYNDVIFDIAKNEPRIKPYYISLKKTVMLMMLVETDIFVMTTPDLNKFYLKRSFIKKDIEYIYVPHDSMSVHMGFNEGALDAFDTIFCSGKHVVNEVKATEKVYNLPSKTLVKFGFPFLDNLVDSASKELKTRKNKKVKEILIAPSWQEDNILDSCIDDIVKKLYSKDYHITIRPHPEYVKRYEYKIKNLVERYKDCNKKMLSFELDFSKNKSIYASDMIITDWSGIANEFCFATKKPAVFINTKMKVCNTNWEKIGITPVEIEIRNKLGVSINKDDIINIDKTIQNLFKKQNSYKSIIDRYYKSFVFNHGNAGEVGANYILKSLVTKKKNKVKKNK